MTSMLIILCQQLECRKETSLAQTSLSDEFYHVPRVSQTKDEISLEMKRSPHSTACASHPLSPPQPPGALQHWMLEGQLDAVLFFCEINP